MNQVFFDKLRKFVLMKDNISNDLHHKAHKFLTQYSFYNTQGIDQYIFHLVKLKLNCNINIYHGHYITHILGHMEHIHVLQRRNHQDIFQDKYHWILITFQNMYYRNDHHHIDIDYILVLYIPYIYHLLLVLGMNM